MTAAGESRGRDWPPASAPLPPDQTQPLSAADPGRGRRPEPAWAAADAQQRPDGGVRAPVRAAATAVAPRPAAGPGHAMTAGGAAPWEDFPAMTAGGVAVEAPPLPGRRERPGGGAAGGAGRRRAGAQTSPPRRSAKGAHVLYLLVLATGVGALAWTWQGGTQRARGGTFAMGSALLIAALARLVLPEGRAGMLASRGRFIDVVTLAALAVGLLVAGLMLPTPS